MQNFFKAIFSNLFYFVFWLFIILLTAKFFLINEDFYQNSFEKSGTYKKVERTLKIFVRDLIVQGFESNFTSLETLSVGQRAEVENLINSNINLITEEKTKKIIDTNIQNATLYLRGESESLIVYYENIIPSYEEEETTATETTINVNEAALETNPSLFTTLANLHNLDEKLNLYLGIVFVLLLFLFIFATILPPNKKLSNSANLIKGAGIRLFIFAILIKAVSNYLTKAYDYWTTPLQLLIASIIPPLLNALFNYYIIASIVLIIFGLIILKLTEKKQRKESKPKNKNIYYTTKPLAA
jgi:hypothetical protein